jgi:hypothetical protein
MSATRRFLEEEDVNEIAQRRAVDADPDVYDLIFTIRKTRREPTNAMMRPIVWGLQDAIHAHGPITRESVSSAAKRVYGRLRGIRI